MKWVSPLLTIGTPDEAHVLGDQYSDDPPEVAYLMRMERRAMVVPTPELAAEVLRLLGYRGEESEQWFADHIFADWQGNLTGF